MQPSKSKQEALTQEYLKSRIHYDPTTGVFTWLRKIERSGYDVDWNRKFAGKIAGTPHSGGRYHVVTVDQYRYLAHRLAFFYFHGWWPDEIDHINRNPSDNRIENLCASSRHDNMMNTGKRSNNTSGFKGVHWYPQTKKWRAGYRHKGVYRCAGFYDTAEEAGAAYIKAVEDFFGARRSA